MSNEQIKVHVTKTDGPFYYMRYQIPGTKKFETRTTKTADKKEALKAAGQWQSELREGRYKPVSKITWEEFRQRYESDVVPGLKRTTGLKVAGVFEAIERIISPEKLSALTAERISHFVTTLRSEPTEVDKKVVTLGTDGRKHVEIQRVTVVVTRAESTIKGILATLKSALNWSKRMKMLHEVPAIDMPKRAKGKVMKGRAITPEEFDRLLAAVPAVRPNDSDVWKWYLRAMWWSGLRLEESLNLWWTDDEAMAAKGLAVDLSGRRPMLWIPAEAEKGNEDRLLPMAPEFAEMLLAVPEADRTGRVFKLPYARKDAVSKVGSEIGERALIKVDEKRKVKYASIHDLRRAFGFRWSSLVMPAVLKEMMRHESIETTMKFYVGRNAQATADVIWQAFAQGQVSKGIVKGDADTSSEESPQVVTPQKRTRQESNLQPTDPKCNEFG